ncbi:MAG: amidohydrolase [Deltaproteobacteria bacterium]|nr:amidohydrolase [Deltaproteobacteria bacterium]
MVIIDADAHVEECPATFSDKYLDPLFRSRRPQVVQSDGRLYWLVEDQLYPRLVGRGCHNMGTPTHYRGEKGFYTAGKPESLESLELSDPAARLQDMDAEELAVQVLYPSFFLVYPLVANPVLGAALCSSYNRWMADVTGGIDRLRWAAVVDLGDVPTAVREVRQAKELGAVSVMVLGTVGERLLDHPCLLPFYEAMAAEDLTLAVHVGWSCPPLSNLYDHLYPSTVIPFIVPVLMGFTALLSGGVLDRFPDLRVGFLEAGCLWVHFLLDRLEHRFAFTRRFGKHVPETAPRAACSPLEYLRRGNLFIATEVEDPLLPQVLDLVGEDRLLFSSDMPHGDRERFAARTLRGRTDISESAKWKILEANPRRLYRI